MIRSQSSLLLLPTSCLRLPIFEYSSRKRIVPRPINSVEHNTAFSPKLISWYNFVISYCLYCQYIGHIVNFCMRTCLKFISRGVKKCPKYIAILLCSTLPINVKAKSNQGELAESFSKRKEMPDFLCPVDSGFFMREMLGRTFLCVSESSKISPYVFKRMGKVVDIQVSIQIQ